MTISNALQNHKNLVVGIGKQGGWQKYERDFCAQLRSIPDQFTSTGNFRKAEFVLLPATKPGIQIADFYVGAIREFLKSQTQNSMPYYFDIINHQIITRDIYSQLALSAARMNER
jgi:hypothetical protein